MRVYGLGYESIAVTAVSNNTSMTGYCPRMEVLRKRHHLILHLIKTVAITP